ncbi:hypothetical protein HYX13_00920 [Candidatus Woesearchaeota archaeon]|nr:hypothetical protein [Candidatus Woesearchaeota archaeon]
MNARQKRVQSLIDSYNENFNKYLHSIANTLTALKEGKPTASWLKRTKEKYQKVLTFYDLLLERGKNTKLEILRKKLPAEFAVEQLMMEEGDFKRIEQEADAIAFMLADSLNEWKNIFGLEPSKETTYLRTR